MTDPTAARPDVPGTHAVDAASPAGPRLSIGALSRATGIPVETIRTWESRYGFPEPERKPSGHRVYPACIVPRLRRVAAALARGHRACECVAASDAELGALLDTNPGQAAPSSGAALPVAEEGVDPLLAAVAAFDAERLTRMLLADWARFGPMEFLARRIVPMLRGVGDAWSSGRLQITHEHFLTERLTDVLRTLRLPFDERADGPLLLCATLPDERHSLGLQMAALVAAVSGWRVLYLGTEVPPEQVTSVVAQTGARAVAISASRVTAGERTRAMLAGIRRGMPNRVQLFVGGEGAPGDEPGVEMLDDFERFRQRLALMAGGA